MFIVGVGGIFLEKYFHFLFSSNYSLYIRAPKWEFYFALCQEMGKNASKRTYRKRF